MAPSSCEKSAATYHMRLKVSFDTPEGTGCRGFTHKSSRGYTAATGARGTTRLYMIARWGLMSKALPERLVTKSKLSMYLRTLCDREFYLSLFSNKPAALAAAGIPVPLKSRPGVQMINGVLALLTGNCRICST